MDEYKGTTALDAGLVSSAGAVEHYWIARHGTLKSWAGRLVFQSAIPLPEATLQEEIATDRKLTALGQSVRTRKLSRKKPADSDATMIRPPLQGGPFRFCVPQTQPLNQITEDQYHGQENHFIAGGSGKYGRHHDQKLHRVDGGELHQFAEERPGRMCSYEIRLYLHLFIASGRARYRHRWVLQFAPMHPRGN